MTRQELSRLHWLGRDIEREQRQLDGLRERGAGDETTGRTCAILSIKHLPFSNQFKHIVPEKARMIPPVRNFMAERYAQMAQGEGSGRQPGKQTCVWNAFPRTS